jgi:hypothetical protein
MSSAMVPALLSVGFVFGSLTFSLVRRIAWACSGVSCDNAIAFSPDGSSVAVTGQGAGGRAADVWNTATGTLVAEVSDPADYKVVSAAFGANGPNWRSAISMAGQRMSEARTWARA